jgi:hypothetical protein
MIIVTQPKPHRLSLQERILALRPETIATTLPRRMRASGAFSERDIALTVAWLLAYREQHHLRVIE